MAYDLFGLVGFLVVQGFEKLGEKNVISMLDATPARALDDLKTTADVVPGMYRLLPWVLHRWGFHLPFQMPTSWSLSYRLWS